MRPDLAAAQQVQAQVGIGEVGGRSGKVVDGDGHGLADVDAEFNRQA